MSDCEPVSKSSCLNCGDNFIELEANESSSDNIQGHNQPKQLEYIYQVQDVLEKKITSTSHSKSNQYVETIIYEGTDSSDDDTQLDCIVDHSSFSNLNDFNNNRSNESLSVVPPDTCNSHFNPVWENYNEMEFNDKCFFNNKDIKDMYIKQKIQSLGNDIFDRYFHTGHLEKSIGHFNLRNLSFSTCDRKLDQIDSIINCVNSTIDQLKRISEGEYLSNVTRERWKDTKVSLRNDDIESHSKNKALRSLSVPINLCASTKSLVSIEEKLCMEKADDSSACDVFEDKVIIDIPKHLGRTLKLFDNRKRNPEVLVPVVGGEVAELSVTFDLQPSLSGNFVSRIKSIMVLPKHGYKGNLAEHIKSREILSVTKFSLSAFSFSLIENKIKNKAIQSETLSDIKTNLEESGSCNMEAEIISNDEKIIDDLPADNLSIRQTIAETKSKHNENALDYIVSSSLVEKSILRNSNKPSENDTGYANDNEISHSTTSACIGSFSPFDDDDLKNHVTDKYENTTQLQTLGNVSMCNSERRLSDDNSVISSNTTISLLDVLGKVSSNSHQFESTTLPVIDDLKATMKTLSIQSCVIEDSEEGHSSHRTVGLDKRLNEIDKQEENVLRKTKKSTKKLLEIRERRKLKSVIEIKRKGSKSYKRRGYLAASASNSTTRLSITNKSFYDSIYGLNRSAGSKKNYKVKSLIKSRPTSRDLVTNENELVTRKNNETVTDSSNFIDSILNEMEYDHKEHNTSITNNRLLKADAISKTVQSIDSMMSTVSTISSDKYTAVPYTLSGRETMQHNASRSQKPYKNIKIVKSPSQYDECEIKLKKMHKNIQKAPLAQPEEVDYRLPIENRQMKIGMPNKTIVNAETSGKVAKTMRAQIKCKKNIDKIYNLMRQIDNPYNTYESSVRTANPSLRTINENSSQMEEGSLNRHHSNPHPRVTATSSSSSNDIIERYAHKNYTLKVPRIIINAKSQPDKIDQYKVTEKLPSQYQSNYTQPTFSSKSTVRKTESNLEKPKVYTDLHNTIRSSDREQYSEIKKKLKNRDPQKRMSRFDDHITTKRVNSVSSATPGEIKKKTHLTLSENTRFILADKHSREIHNRLMELKDEEREARGEAVRGPPRFPNHKDYIKRLDTLAQPKRAYVQAHCEEFKHKLAPVMSNRLAKIISLSHSKTRKPSSKHRTVAQGGPTLKELGRHPKHNSGRTQVQERRTRSSCSLISHNRSTLSHCSLSPKRGSEKTEGMNEESPTDGNMYDTQSYILNHFDKQTSNVDIQLKSSISINMLAYESKALLKPEENLEISNNSNLVNPHNVLSESNFHVFNECLHEFLNKVLSRTISQTNETDEIQIDDESSDSAGCDADKIAKVRNGIVTIESSELFDLNYGQRVYPLHSCQSIFYSFDVESSIEKTPIQSNNLLSSAANNLIPNNSIFVLNDCNSQTLIRYMPSVITNERCSTNIQNRLQLPNITNLSKQSSKNTLFLQAGDASLASGGVAEPVQKYIRSSSTSPCVDNYSDYHCTSFRNVHLSHTPFTKVDCDIRSKNIQYKKLIHVIHILNFSSVVHIATVWHICQRYEMIKHNSTKDSTLTVAGMHNWMNKKQTESFVKVLNILTELQGISNGLTQVITVVGFQHVYHPVYAIKQHCTSFYYITSFTYIIYYDTIKLHKDDYSKCLAPYSNFYSIYASDCGDLICNKHAYMTGSNYVGNEDAVAMSKWGKEENSNFSIHICNVCTSVQTIQSLTSNSSLSTRTYETSSTGLTNKKKRITIFCRKQSLTIPSDSTTSYLPNMAGDIMIPNSNNCPIELKDISTSSASIQRLGTETKMKRNMLLTMYFVLVVIIFSMLSLPQFLVTLLY